VGGYQIVVAQYIFHDWVVGWN